MLNGSQVDQDSIYHNLNVKLKREKRPFESIS